MYLHQPVKRPIDEALHPPRPVPVPQSSESGAVRNVSMALHHPPRALLFDVFGTCVDWRTSVVKTLVEQCHMTLSDSAASIATSVRMKASDMTTDDWGEFAQQWRNEYKSFCKSVANDPTLPWKSIDEHHLESLRALLKSWKLEGLWIDEQVRALSLVWRQLLPWPDAGPAIRDLNMFFWTVSLSNANLSLLEDLRVFAKLPFTHILSAELFGSYKPAPVVYRGAVEKLGLMPKDCAMVAAHLSDLRAAKACGLQTIYVERPQEEDWDAEAVEKARVDGSVDLWISADQEGFTALAEQLGVQVHKERRLSRSA